MNMSRAIVITSTLFWAPFSFSATNQEIPVTLFGQPCSMSGPFPKNTLTFFHEISPEKITPDLSLIQMKKLLAKASEKKSIPHPVPVPLENYREHLRKRLAAKVAFEEALVQLKKAKDTEARKALESALKNLKEHILSVYFPEFETYVKKTFETQESKVSPTFIALLREKYESFIQPDTEEEFHKAIRQVKIQYNCVFEDSDQKQEENVD